MENDNTLSSKLTRIETAVGRIRTKTDTANDVIEDVATAVESMTTPTGNINITTTSSTNVANYATAQVVDANLAANNIKKDVTILGVTGNLEPGITPTGNINITDTSSTDVTNYATAQVVDANLVAGNIKKDTTILGVTGNYEGSGGSGSKNAYTKATVQEMQAISDASAGDICVVTSLSETPFTQSYTGGTLKAPATVTLSSAFTGSAYLYCMGNANLDGQVSSSNAYFSFYDYQSGSSQEIRFTSSDGITYTRTSSQDTLDVPENAIMDILEWDNVFGSFLTIIDFSYSGQYTYDGTNWNTSYIGTSADASDILMDKTAYTSSGIITGTRDLGNYFPINYAIQATAPTDTKKIWITLKSGVDYSKFADFNKCKEGYGRVSFAGANPSIGQNISVYKELSSLPTSGPYSTVQIGDCLYLNYSDGTMKKIDMANDFAVSSCTSFPSSGYFSSGSPIVCGDGSRYIYYMYGNNSRTLYQYDTQNNSYASKASIPNTPQSGSRYMCYNTKLDRVYVNYYINNYASENRKCYYWTPSSNSWTADSNRLMGVPSCSPCSMLIYSDANADYYGTVNRIGYHDNSGGNSGGWYKATNDTSNPFGTAEPKPRVHDTGYQSLGMGTTAIAKVNDGFLFIYNDLLCHAIVSSTQSVASTLVLDDVEVYPFYKKFGKNTRLLGSKYDSVNNDLYLIVTGQNNTSYFYQKYGVIKFTNLSKTPTNVVSRQSIIFVLGGVYGAYYHPITGIRNDLKDIVLTDYDWNDSSAPFDTKDLNLVDDVKYYNNGWVSFFNK